MSDPSMSERYDHVDDALDREDDAKRALREQWRFEAAKAAMQGMLSDAESVAQPSTAECRLMGIPEGTFTWRDHSPKLHALRAVVFANALLAALDALDAPPAKGAADG